MSISLIFFKAQSNAHLTRIRGEKTLFPLWHSVIPLSNLKRFWSEQQSQTFLINSLIHFERMHLALSISAREKNHSQHNSPLNGPCLTRTGSSWEQMRSESELRRSTGTSNTLPLGLLISTLKVTQSICQFCPSRISRDVPFNTINNVKIDTWSGNDSHTFPPEKLQFVRLPLGLP